MVLPQMSERVSQIMACGPWALVPMRLYAALLLSTSRRATVPAASGQRRACLD